MTKEDLYDSVEDAFFFRDLYASGRLLEKVGGERRIWNDAVKARVTLYLAACSVTEAKRFWRDIARRQLMVDVPALFENEKEKAWFVESALMYTRLTVIRYFRRHRCMNHSPLREIERQWLDRLFSGRERISELRIFIEFDCGASTPEETGGHVNGYGQYFICKNCPDSRKTSGRPTVNGSAI